MRRRFVPETYAWAACATALTAASSVVSIPRELETRGFAPGTCSVLVEELETGELRIIPTEQVRARIRDVGQRLGGEHAEALKILADTIPPAAPPSAR